MLFVPIELSDSAITQQRLSNRIDAANAFLANTESVFKNNWNSFWDRSLTQTEMQSVLDSASQTAATDPVDQSVTNALGKFFAVALRWIAIIQTENPTAFSDSRYDTTGQCREYLTPGWTYTVDQNTGRFVVIAPCVWVDNE